MPAKKVTDDSTPDTPPENPDAETTESTDQAVWSDDAIEGLAEEVLGGRWGDHHSARIALTEAGHEASKVLTRVNQRIAGGAPSAYPAETINLLQEVQDGEWGPEKGLYQRLTAAGFSPAAVEAVRRHNEAS